MSVSIVWRTISLAGALCFCMAASAVAQKSLPVALGLLVGSIPVGRQPLGIDISAPFTAERVYVAVANSGDDSVSILALNLGTISAPAITISTAGKVAGIPSPYAVAACPRGGFLVTSPSENTVRVLSSLGAVMGTVEVGRQPRSVACFQDSLTRKRMGVVSNFADNSLSVFDVGALIVTTIIQNVPGSRGFHGILVTNGGLTAYVAGTDANILSEVDLSTFRILRQIPVPHPTAVILAGGTLAVTSAENNAIVYYPNGLQGVGRSQDVPNPQDAVGSNIGLFIAVGGQDFLWCGGCQDTPSVIPKIPTVGLAATSFGLGQVGQIRPRVPFNAVLATSTDSNSVFLVQRQTALPSEFSITNAASFAAPQATPGMLVSIFAATGATQFFRVDSLPLPTSLGGFTLSIGGVLNFNAASGYSSTGGTNAPLLFVGPSQINFQIPPGNAPGSGVPAQLMKPDGTTLLTTVNITATAPGIFSVLQNGQGQGAVLNQDNSQNGNPQSIVGAKPAQRGGLIQIYATGAGETTPPLLQGEPAPASGNPLVLTNVQPTVTIGGQAARVLFSGMAPGFVGLWQINAEVPQNVTPGPAVPLVISAGGNTSNTVTIAVE